MPKGEEESKVCESRGSQRVGCTVDCSTTKLTAERMRLKARATKTSHGPKGNREQEMLDSTLFLEA